MISPTVGLQGPRSIRHDQSAQNTRKRSMASYSAACIELSDDNLCEEDGGYDDCGHFGDKKRRLTFEQVKTLEKSFEVGNKLDPERKMQLARALGLQPRQIAVWFQNRRARWKNKQLEKDYDALKHDHDALKTNYDTLLQEHRQFKDEVQRLKRELVSKDERNRKGRSGPELESQQKSTALFNPIAISKSEMLITGRDSQEGAGCSSEGSSVLDIDSPRTIDSPLSPQQAVREVPAELAEQSVYCQNILPKVEGGSVAMSEEEETCCNLFCCYEEQGPMLWEYCHWSHEL